MSNKNIDKNDPTKEQLDCVNFDSGDLLIKGVAGSGKSYVILKRALNLLETRPANESVAIFTYTNALVKYMDDLMTSRIKTGRLIVDTIDRYCIGLYSDIYRRRISISNDDGKDLISEAIRKHRSHSGVKHRLYDVDVAFYVDEFRWIKEKCITTREGYLSANRKGRGSQVKLYKKDRDMVWEIYVNFMDIAKKKKYYCWPDLYVDLNNEIEAIPEGRKICHILIDEAQDLTFGKLKIMKALSRKSLTIAADMAQKIYKTSFTWKEVGIDISGNSSKTLSKSFRSTKQIVELAEDLLRNNRVQDKETNEYTEAQFPKREGDKPRLVTFRSKKAEDKYLIDLLKEYPVDEDVIGIICRTDANIREMKKLLAKGGLPYEVVDNSNKNNAQWSLLTPGIKLVKAHSSKGLEFERVIIPDLHDDRYPIKTFNVEEDQLEEHLQIERSLLYVAMTRARSTLMMLCVEASKSRFIDEFEDEHMEVEYIDE